MRRPASAAVVALSGGGALLAAVACAGSPPGAAPAARAAPSYVAPARSGAECAPVLARVAAGQDTAGLEPPRPQFTTIPPTPPAALRGREVLLEIPVDERGGVIRDSVRVLGLADERYAGQLRASAAGYRFHPAVLEGCAVPGRFRVRLRL